MSEAQQTAEDAGTAQAGGSQSAGGSRKFTQDEVNALLAKERRSAEAKYEGFDQYKADSAELKELKQAQMTDLDKARSQLDEVTKERDALKSANDRAAWVNEVASQTKVPAAIVEMLSGKTKEELLEQAKKLAPDFAESVGTEGGAPANTGEDAKTKFVSDLFKGN